MVVAGTAASGLVAVPRGAPHPRAVATDARAHRPVRRRLGHGAGGRESYPADAVYRYVPVRAERGVARSRVLSPPALDAAGRRGRGATRRPGLSFTCRPGCSPRAAVRAAPAGSARQRALHRLRTPTCATGGRLARRDRTDGPPRHDAAQ